MISELPAIFEVKKITESVVGDEVEVILEEDGRQGHLGLEEVGDLVIDVEDHRHG